MSSCLFSSISSHVDWYTPDDRTDRPALGAIHGSDATLIVEGGSSVAHLSAFLSELAARGRPPFVAIALTHWHWDHTFGSAALDVPVISHRDTAAELAIQAAYDWSDEALDERVRDGREIAFCAEMMRLELGDRANLRIVVPTVTFTSEHVIDVGGAHAVIRHVGGDHAQDSSVVYVPEDRVLFLGDCLYQRLYAPEPFLTVAGIRKLLGALAEFKVEAAVESHCAEVADAQSYAYRLSTLKEAADIVESDGSSAEARTGGSPEVREAIGFLLTGERRS